MSALLSHRFTFITCGLRQLPDHQMAATCDQRKVTNIRRLDGKRLAITQG